MQTLTQHKPTPFDHSAASFFDYGDPRRDWLVLPVSITRDTGAFQKSNFIAALKHMGGESETVEVHRFGHWGPGWYEIIIADPSRAPEVEALYKALEDYPLLDEDDYSDRSYSQQCETWSACYSSDFRKEVIAAMPEDLQEWIENTPEEFWFEIEHIAQDLAEWGEDSQGQSYLCNFARVVESITERFS